MKSNIQLVNDMPLLDAALFYADHFDFKIFPITAGTKKPAIEGKNSENGKGGFHWATNNPTQIRQWWEGEYRECNIGLSVAASGLVVIDVDDYKEECDWDKFIEDNNITPTLTQASASGGMHYFFKCDQGETFSKHLKHKDGTTVKGVDILHNGYVLLSPSKIASN